MKSLGQECSNASKFSADGEDGMKIGDSFTASNKLDVMTSRQFNRLTFLNMGIIFYTWRTNNATELQFSELLHGAVVCSWYCRKNLVDHLFCCVRYSNYKDQDTQKWGANLDDDNSRDDRPELYPCPTHELTTWQNNIRQGNEEMVDSRLSADVLFNQSQPIFLFIFIICGTAVLCMGLFP